jgi:hypothetical protein
MDVHDRGTFRLAAFQHRKAACIERLIDHMSAEMTELEREITFEEARTGIVDRNNFAYPTYAKAAVLRHDNLRRSVEELRSSRALEAG